MKKLPVLLLMLTLAGMVPASEVSALETEEEQGAIEVEERATTELPVIHQLDQRMHIQAVRPREGLVEIEVMSPIGEQLQAQRIWFATIDYENGWTEAEVDGLLDDWTTLEADWARATKAYPFKNALYHFYATIPLSIGESRYQYNLTEVNLPDVLYYATEFKDLADEEAGTFWVRGKVDYRGCAHSQRFETRETGTCVEVTDWDAKTTKYLADGATGDEEVMTWEEEWRLVLAGRLATIGAVLDGLAMIPDLSEEALEQSLVIEEAKLETIEGLLAKATGVSEGIKEAGKLRERMAKMRSDASGGSLGEGNGSQSGGVSGSETGNGSLSGTGSGSGVTGGPEGASGGSEGSSEGGSGNTDGLGGSSGDLSGDLGGSSGGLSNSSSSSLNSPDFGGVSVELAVNNNVIGSTSGGFEGIVEDMGDSGVSPEVFTGVEDEVEVPKLGGAKVINRGGWIWWVMGISGALTLFLVVALKRKQRK